MSNNMKARELKKLTKKIETLDLPTAEIFELELFDPFESDDELQELILDYLSNKYGFCVNNFSFRLTTTHVIVENIEWDTTE